MDLEILQQLMSLTSVIIAILVLILLGRWLIVDSTMAVTGAQIFNCRLPKAKLSACRARNCRAERIGS